MVAWVEYRKDIGFGGRESLNGKSNDPKTRQSPMVKLLERLFNSSVDVQCSEGTACHLRYVAGYVSKASDALAFKRKESQGLSTWKQTYRLLCKRAPLLPEMAFEFAQLPLMRASFRGDNIFPPIPGSHAKNKHRLLYKLFLQDRKAYKDFLSVKIVGKQTPQLNISRSIEYARQFDVAPSWPNGPDGEPVLTRKVRGSRGAGSNKEP